MADTMFLVVGGTFFIGLVIVVVLTWIGMIDITTGTIVSVVLIALLGGMVAYITYKLNEADDTTISGQNYDNKTLL